MKRFAGWAVSAGLMLAASAANAQMLTPYRAVSDFDGPYERPYAAVPPPAYNSPAPPPVYNYGGYAGPALLPPHEVYAVLRDNGFSPLGIPHQRGYVYTIAVLDRNGDDGRLVIDARNGRIIRFVPADGYGSGGYGSGGYGPAPYGESYDAAPMSGYGPESALPPPIVIRGVPRPPAPIPHVASRNVPVPAPKPAVARRSPEPARQQSAAVETKPAPTSAPPTAPAQPGAAPSAQAAASPPPSSATVGEAKPAAPVIRPTQEMPKVQGLE